MKIFRLAKLFVGDVRREGLVKAYRFWRIEQDQLKNVDKIFKEFKD